MITLLKNLFGRYAVRHLRLEQSQGKLGFLVRLEQNQIVVSGKLPANLRPVRVLRLVTGKLERDNRPDPADGSFSLSAPFSPGPVTLLIESETARSEAEQAFVLPGFSSARLRMARLHLVPGFIRRLVLSLPDALRWYRHQDPAARIRLRDALGLAPPDVAPLLDPGILVHKEAAPESESDEVFTPIILIMPVFDAFDDVVEALEHLQRNTSEPWHLVLVEDCSSDPRIRPYLRQWAGAINDREAAGQVELLENDENVGFIGAVNRGFGRALELLDGISDQEGAAIALLNSDAFLPTNWAARLLSPIKADARVASVTPMSNNGELLSVPFLSRPVQLAPGLAEAMDKVAASLTPFAKGGPDMPTGVGFCMAISLAWLRQVGLFDTRFGAGYGEEVDWCQRALALGGRHVSQPALFVEHRGGASFGSEQKQRLLAKNGARLARLYPGFNAQVQAFITADPLLGPRLVLGLVWAGENARKRELGPVSVYLAHALGGGAQMDLSRRIKNEIQAGAAVVVLRVGAGPARWQIELHGAEGVTMGSTDDFELPRGDPLAGRGVYTPRSMDWHSRKVLAWRLSNTLEADFCVDALKEALARYGKPEIFNTDQGSQFTSASWIETPMTLKGCERFAILSCLNNMSKRFKQREDQDQHGWQGALDRQPHDRAPVATLMVCKGKPLPCSGSLKYECVYLHAFETGSEAKAGIRKWLAYYNAERPHSTHGILTPDEVHASKTEPMKMAA